MKKIITILIISSLLFLASCGEEKLKVINEDTGEVEMSAEELERAKKMAVELGILGEEEEKIQSLEAVGADAFEAVVNSGEYMVLDLRTNGELEQSGIIGESVMQIDVYEDPKYLEKLQNLDPGEKYAIYCRSGGRSGSILGKMRELGFLNVVELDGGIGNWARSGKEFIGFDESRLLSLSLEK